jgi:hypothetical protein
MHGRKTWSLIFREENRIRAFVNRVLRRMSGRKRDVVAGGFKTLLTEELQKLYSLPQII